MKSKIIHLIGMLVASMAGYYLIKMMQSYIPEGATVSAPWAVVGLMQLPLSYAIQAILKTNEVTDHTSLTPSELRRLSPKVKSKRRNMVSLLVFYVLSTLFVILGLMASASNQDVLFIVLRISAGLLFISLYTSIFIHKTMIEVQHLKENLNRRDAEKKSKDSFLDKLK